MKHDSLEQPLVGLSMRDYIVKYQRLYNESTTQVALRSLLMEDRLYPVGSRHRFMTQSSGPSYISRTRLPFAAVILYSFENFDFQECDI